MHHYKLIFYDPLIESQFQLFKMETIRYPIYRVVNIVLILYVIGQSVQDYLTNQFYFAYPKTAFFIFQMIQGVYIMGHRIHTSKALTISNCLFMLFQLQRVEDSQNSYLQGSNMMMAHIMVIFITNFTEALFQIIFLYITRITISSSYSNNISIQDYIFTTFVTALMIYTKHHKDMGGRQLYLQTLRETQWENIIPQIIQQPFLLFTFNDDNMKFNVKSSNLDSQYSNILQEGQVNKKPIKNIIYESLIKTIKPTTYNFRMQHMLVQYNKRRLHTDLFQLFLEKPHYLLLINHNFELYKKLEYRTTRIITSFQQQIFQMNRLIHSSIQQRSLQLLQSTQKGLSYIHLFNFLNQNKPNFKNFFRELIKFYTFSHGIKIKIKIVIKVNLEQQINKHMIVSFINLIYQFNEIKDIEIIQIWNSIGIKISGQIKNKSHKIQQIDTNCNYYNVNLEYVYQYEIK